MNIYINNSMNNYKLYIVVLQNKTNKQAKSLLKMAT